MGAAPKGPRAAPSAARVQTAGAAPGRVGWGPLLSQAPQGRAAGTGTCSWKPTWPLSRVVMLAAAPRGTMAPVSSPSHRYQATSLLFPAHKEKPGYNMVIVVACEKDWLQVSRNHLCFLTGMSIGLRSYVRSCSMYRVWATPSLLSQRWQHWPTCCCSFMQFVAGP